MSDEETDRLAADIARRLDALSDETERGWTGLVENGGYIFSREVRGVRQASHDVLADAEVPAILIEAGFLDHPVEGRVLASAVGQAATAHLIASGILAFVGQRRAQQVAAAAPDGPIAFARALTPR